MVCASLLTETEETQYEQVGDLRDSRAPCGDDKVCHFMGVFVHTLIAEVGGGGAINSQEFVLHDADLCLGLGWFRMIGLIMLVAKIIILMTRMIIAETCRNAARDSDNSLWGTAAFRGGAVEPAPCFLELVLHDMEHSPRVG